MLQIHALYQQMETKPRQSVQTHVRVPDLLGGLIPSIIILVLQDVILAQMSTRLRWGKAELRSQKVSNSPITVSQLPVSFTRNSGSSLSAV